MVADGGANAIRSRREVGLSQGFLPTSRPRRRAMRRTLRQQWSTIRPPTPRSKATICAVS